MFRFVPVTNSHILTQIALSGHERLTLCSEIFIVLSMTGDKECLELGVSLSDLWDDLEVSLCALGEIIFFSCESTFWHVKWCEKNTVPDLTKIFLDSLVKTFWWKINTFQGGSYMSLSKGDLNYQFKMSSVKKAHLITC